MPLLRYFVFVGGALLALLFVCDAVLPQVPLPENLSSGSDFPAVRIHSDRKWPERVVFDTSVAPLTVAAAQATPIVPPATAEASAKDRVRDALAQLPPAQSEKVAVVPGVETGKAQLKPQQKRKIARARPAGHPVLMVAQQPHYGVFDNTW